MKKFLSFMLVFTLLFTSIANAQSTVAYREELNAVTTDDFGNLFPYDVNENTYSMEVMYMIYDTLMIYDELLSVNYLMIKDAKIENDYKTYTVTLRDDLYWHDGKKVTGEDVKFSVEYAKKSNNGMFKTSVKAIDTVTVNSDTVTFNLNKSTPDFYKETFVVLPIIPKHVYQNGKPKSLVGSGPYKLTKYEENKGYTLTAFDKYNVKKPTVNTINITVEKDTQKIIDGLNDNTYSVVTGNITPEIFTGVTNVLVEKEEENSLDSEVMFLNFDNKYLKNNDVRKALSMAVNFDSISETVYDEFFVKGNPAYYRTYIDFAYRDSKYSYDLSKAGSMLDNAGYKKDANGVRFELTLGYESETQKQIANIIKADLESLGIKVTVKQGEADLMLKRVYGYPMEHESGVMSLLEEGYLNYSKYTSDSMKKVIAKYNSSVTPEDRYYALVDIQKAVVEEVPFVTIGYATNLHIYNYGQFSSYLERSGCGVFNKMSFVENKKTFAAKANEEVLNQNENMEVSAPFAIGVGAFVVGVGVLTYFYMKKSKKFNK